MSDEPRSPTGEPVDEAGREAEILRGRRDSLERLRAAAVAPFAIRFEPDAHAADLLAEFEGALEPGEESDRRATLAGRVVLARRMGKLTFLVLRDAAADLQLFVEEGALDERSRALLDEIDLGDIVGAKGQVVRTKRGELSLKVRTLTMLTKALRPLPEKWHGLRDPDLQQRRRYLHLATDLEARRPATARAAMLRTIRSQLDDRGFLEVETPVLQAVAGGANARPFTTHHHALDMDMKLRISLELFLKRLMVGGLERVYEIGRIFRNEGIDRDHNPEFTMLELYQAYGDYHDIMELTRALVLASAHAVLGTTTVAFGGHDISLEGEWARVSLLASVADAVGEPVTLNHADLPGLAARHGVGVDPTWGPGKIVQELFDTLVEPTLIAPTFVCDFPREVSPLARPHRDDPALTEHFDLVIGGVELATAFSELTDPDDQRARFEAQLVAREAGDEEAHPLDEDFLRALEHGMPPVGGVGLGIDRLLKFLLGAATLRDVILFPHHRPEA
ncbi:MAG: lysine--tRNA ligase [Actinobacteria bacterium]|nr:lysine--tRNA ligase [Actinomycetota bacterium]